MLAHIAILPGAGVVGHVQVEVIDCLKISAQIHHFLLLFFPFL